jgi:CO/xanthine dehydrogenase Mo-binding subunit
MSAIPGTSGRYIGKPIRRLHDRRLVTGTGQFVGDVRIPGTLSAVFVRSPYAHARITSIDASPAMELEGVVTILTGTDLPLLMHPLVTDHEYPPHRHLERYPLATDIARFAGDARHVRTGCARLGTWRRCLSSTWPSRCQLRCDRRK